jgi:hypothetical protein
MIIAIMIVLGCGGSDSEIGQSRAKGRAATDHYDTVQKAYIAYYGRPADSGGLEYWAGRISETGDLADIIEAFGNSQEFTDRYGSLSNSDLVTTLYQQLYNRAPDSSGHSYYTQQLDNGTKSLQQISLDVLYGSQGADLSKINNKVTAAKSFTDAVQSVGLDYPLTYAVSYLSGIDESESSVTTSKSTMDRYLGTDTSVVSSGNVSEVLFTHYPVAISELESISPLGNMNGYASHAMPTDHLYFHTDRNLSSVDIFSPGDMTLTYITSTKKDTGSSVTYDYVLQATIGENIIFQFSHVNTITQDLLDAVPNLGSTCHDSYFLDDATYTQCYESVSVPLTGGTKIGTMGDSGSWVLDVYMYDKRVELGFVNPVRSVGSGIANESHTVCFMDYMEAEKAASLNALLGESTGFRTADPVCGQIMFDVGATAQGRWWKDGCDDVYGCNVGLVYDNVEPTVGIVSVGGGIDSLPVGGYAFNVAESGTVNLNFSKVKADGKVYCYEPLTSGVSGEYLRNFTSSSFTYYSSGVHILVHMPSFDKLQVAGVAGATCQGETEMPAGYTTFVR